MTSDDFINVAINLGQRDGVAALDPAQRMVFLIAEAETDCDINGIDTFLDRYPPDLIAEAAAAFDAVGAAEIAAAMRLASKDALYSGDLRLDRLNKLIVGRVGYDYESIIRVVDERRQTNR